MTTLADKFETREGIYLLNHSVGLPPADARQHANEAFFEPWGKADGEAWTAWLAAIDTFRGALGRLLNTSASNICPQSNVSSALTKIIYSLPREAKRKTLLLSEQDFPTVGFVASRAEAFGYRLKFIPAAHDVLDVAVWKSHMTDDVCALLLTQVYSNTSEQLPLQELLSLARQEGVISIVDAAQAVGIVPSDLSQLAPDFFLGSCVKWLCGGPGAAFLWANPEIVQRCLPTDVGWFSHADPMAFDIRQFRYADGVLRFWGGTPSVLPFAVAAHSIGLLADIGIERIRAHNETLTQQLLAAVGFEHCVTPINPAERGGTLVFHFGERQERVLGELTRAGVRYDQRASGLRLSPHVYNSREEIDTVAQCLRG